MPLVNPLRRMRMRQMRRMPTPAALLAVLPAALLAAAAAPAGAVTLYDAALGTLPSAQGWTLGVTTGATPGTQAVAGNLYTLDSTAAGNAYGNARISPVTLNTATGFELSFSLRVQTETHTDNQRAGYSVLVVGANPANAIELSFWGSNIWALNYDGTQTAEPFFHGSDVAFDTSAALRTYTLAVSNQQFALSTGGSTLLAGALRNYTPSGLMAYQVPNAIFFGDDTSRASSVTQLGFVAVSAVAEPAPAALLLAGGALLALRRRMAGAAVKPPAISAA